MILRQSAHAALVRGLTSNVSNAEVKPIQPFRCLAFPLLRPQKTALKRLILGNELVTSFIWIGNETPHFVQIGSRHSPGTRLDLHIGAIPVALSKEDHSCPPSRHCRLKPSGLKPAGVRGFWERNLTLICSRVHEVRPKCETELNVG